MNVNFMTYLEGIKQTRLTLAKTNCVRNEKDIQI